MTKQEAIEILSALWKKDILSVDGQDALVIAIKALEQKWIPVTERFPEVGTEVIVTYEQEDVTKVDKTTYTKRGFLIAPVTAWMPMIEPYKAESEEV